MEKAIAGFIEAKRMKVNYASFPMPANNENPFIGLLCKWLAEQGWQLHGFNFNIPNLIRNKQKVGVCYFHWPESIWRSKSLLYNYIKGLYFILNCTTAKFLGYKLIWSAHNKLPHEYRSYYFEILLRKFIVRYFDLIIGHSVNTYSDLKSIIKTDFSKKYVLAEHGFYEDVYQPANTITRESLGIPENKIIVLLKASSKGYQGTNTVLNYIKSNKINSRFHFLIFGKEHIEHDFQFNEANPVSLYKRKINETELADLLKMSDFVLMPYTSITTSGFYFLAMTFHKPVIAPGIDFFTENSLPGTVLLYPPANFDDGLNTIFDDIILNRWKKSEADFLSLEKKYNWELSSKKITKAYQHAIDH